MDNISDHANLASTTLAPAPFFKKADAHVQYLARTLIEYLEFRHFLPREILGLPAIWHILEGLQTEEWYNKNITATRSDEGQILIFIGGPDHVLRYYCPGTDNEPAAPAGYVVEAQDVLGAVARQALVASDAQAHTAAAPLQKSSKSSYEDRIKAGRETAERLWQKAIEKAQKQKNPEKKIMILHAEFLRYIERLGKVELLWQKLYDPICKTVFKQAPQLQGMLRIPSSLPLKLAVDVPPENMEKMGDIARTAIMPIARRINALEYIYRSLGPERADNIALFATNRVFKDHTALIVVTRDREKLEEAILRDIVDSLGANVWDEWTLRGSDGEVAIVFLLADKKTGKPVSDEAISGLRAKAGTFVEPRYVVMPQIIADTIMDVESLHMTPPDAPAVPRITGAISTNLPIIQKQLAEIKRPRIDPESALHLKVKSSNDLPKVAIGTVHRHETPGFKAAAYGIISDAEMEKERAAVIGAFDTVELPEPVSQEIRDYVASLKTAVLDDVARHKHRAIVKIDELLEKEKKYSDSEVKARVQALEEVHKRLEYSYYHLNPDQIDSHKAFVEEVFKKRMKILERAEKSFPFLKEIFEHFRMLLTSDLAQILQNIDDNKERSDAFITRQSLPKLVKLANMADRKYAAIGKELYPLFIDILSELRAGPAPAKRSVKTPERQGDIIIISQSFDIVSFLTLWALYEEEAKGGMPIAAVVTEEGAPQSHWVMLATFLGIPVVTAPYNKDFGIDNGCAFIGDNRQVVVDADSGTVSVNPTSEELSQAITKRQSLEHLNRFARQRSALPAGLGIALPKGERVARPDERPVTLEAYLNVDFIQIFTHYVKQQLTTVYGDGVGLVRSEFEFVNDVHNLSNLYESLAKTFGNRRIIIRTIDYEPDKAGNPQLPASQEYRGIDYYKHEGSGVIMTQLQAILLAFHKHRQMRVMFPMIRGTEDLDFVLGLLDRAKDTVSREHKIPKGELNIEIGAMIETPAAVKQLSAIMDKVNFVSFGTNDLIKLQYGVDRDSPKSQAIYRSFKKDIALAIRDACEAANNQQYPLFEGLKTKDVCVCGDAARSYKYFFYLAHMQKRYPAIKIHPSTLNQYLPWLKEMMCWVTDTELARIFDTLNEKTDDKQEALINQQLEELYATAYKRLMDSKAYKDFLLSGAGKTEQKERQLRLPSMEEMARESGMQPMLSDDPHHAAATFNIIAPQGLHMSQEQEMLKYLKELKQHFVPIVRNDIKARLAQRLREEGTPDTELTDTRLELALKDWVKKQLVDERYNLRKESIIAKFLGSKGFEGRALRSETTAITAGQKPMDGELRELMSRELSLALAQQDLEEYFRAKVTDKLERKYRDDVRREFERVHRRAITEELARQGLSGNELLDAYTAKEEELVEPLVKQKIDAVIAADQSGFAAQVEEALAIDIERRLGRIIKDTIEKDLPARGYKISLAILDSNNSEVSRIELKEEGSSFMASPEFLQFGHLSHSYKTLRIEVDMWPDPAKVIDTLMYIINSDGHRPPHEDVATKAKGPGPTDMARSVSPVARLLVSVHELAWPQMQAAVAKTGRKIFLSDSLFDSNDAIALSSAINKDIVEIVDLKELKRLATNTMTAKDKVACVMSRADFKKIQSEGLNEQNNKATIVVLEQDLQNENYLYTEGVIGIADALMNADRQKVLAYSEKLFITPMSNEVLNMLLNDNQVLFFNIVKAFTFKPIEIWNTEDLPRLKEIMENYLRAA